MIVLESEETLPMHTHSFSFHTAAKEVVHLGKRTLSPGHNPPGHNPPGHNPPGHYPPDIIPPTLGHYPPGCIYLSVSDKVESGVPNMCLHRPPNYS